MEKNYKCTKIEYFCIETIWNAVLWLRIEMVLSYVASTGLGSKDRQLPYNIGSDFNSNFQKNCHQYCLGPVAWYT